MNTNRFHLFGLLFTAFLLFFIGAFQANAFFGPSYFREMISTSTPTVFGPQYQTTNRAVRIPSVSTSTSSTNVCNDSTEVLRLKNLVEKYKQQVQDLQKNLLINNRNTYNKTQYNTSSQQENQLKIKKVDSKIDSLVFSFSIGDRRIQPTEKINISCFEKNRSSNPELFSVSAFGYEVLVENLSSNFFYECRAGILLNSGEIIEQTPWKTYKTKSSKELAGRCYDSDSGKDFFRKGTVTFGSETYEDRCSGQYNSLTEYSCAGDYRIESNNIQCQDGCNNGACINKTKYVTQKVHCNFYGDSAYKSHSCFSSAGSCSGVGSCETFITAQEGSLVDWKSPNCSADTDNNNEVSSGDRSLNFYCN